LLVLLGILLFLFSHASFSIGQSQFQFDVRGIGFLLVLVVLMLELKDKLMAHGELAVGRAVQLALLPDRNPELSGWDAWLYTRPANDVGGDLVDYLPLEGKGVGLALGDVSGKGRGAALLRAKLQATVRALATETPILSELGSRLNAIFCRDQVSGRFATLVYLEVLPDRGSVRVLNAGHMPPLIVTDASVESLEPVAPPLGILPDARYEEQVLAGEPGSLLLVYSDGVTEARDRSGAFFGEDRLQDLLPRLRGMTAQAAGRRIVDVVESFVGEERLSDDLSLIVLKRLG
jgi:sigma-B regulation protein RsbU (phosphoserine phosphatase)